MRYGGRFFVALPVAVGLVLAADSRAAEITADGTTCTLANAIRSANMNSSVMGCTAGSGADTINLTVDVNIVTPENVPESIGMPDITSPITIRGNGHTIARTGMGTFLIFRVAANGELTLERLTVKDGGGDGFGGNGGGALIEQGILIVLDSTFTGNKAAKGAGIMNFAGELGISGSTFENNTASSVGGGVENDGGTTIVVNSTFSGNKAMDSGVRGGSAINNPSGTVTVVHSTFASNTAVEGLSAAIFANSTFNVQSSIFDPNNTPASCDGTAGITDLGNNLGDNCVGVNVQPLTGFDISLLDNGGPTKTHKLFDGSSAVNTAGQCGLANDQRGSLRFDGMCDSGAYEFAATCRVLTFKDQDFSTGSTLDYSRCIIEVGPNVGIKNSTTVKFTVGKHLVLDNGFSVDLLSKLEVFIDPALNSSMLTTREAVTRALRQARRARQE